MLSIQELVSVLDGELTEEKKEKRSLRGKAALFIEDWIEI